jgi:hypothetical protein
MLTAIAVPYSALPLEFIAAFGLEQRVHERGGERELQFRQGSAGAILPVWHEGHFLLASWGCKRGESRVLPACGWTKPVTVASGWWAAVGAEEVEIPASLGLDRGDLVCHSGGQPWIVGTGRTRCAARVRLVPAGEPLLPHHDQVGAGAHVDRRADLKATWPPSLAKPGIQPHILDGQWSSEAS